MTIRYTLIIILSFETKRKELDLINQKLGEKNQELNEKNQELQAALARIRELEEEKEKANQ